MSDRCSRREELHLQGVAKTVAMVIGMGAAVYVVRPLVIVHGTNCFPYPDQPNCLFRLKQISLASLMYAADNNERLAPVKRWNSLVAHGVKEQENLSCPEVPGGKFGYAFNGLLENSSLYLEGVELVPLAYDSWKREPNAVDYFFSSFQPNRHKVRDRHLGNVSYAGGYVRPGKANEHIGPVAPPR